jgi:hypothetical protein
VDSHPQAANTLRPKPDRCRQHQVRPIRFQQVGGANVGLTSPGNQADHVHQRLCRLAPIVRQIADFIQCQNVGVVWTRFRLSRVLKLLVVPIQVESGKRHGPLRIRTKSAAAGSLPPSL